MHPDSTEFKACVGEPSDGTRYGRFGITLEQRPGSLLPRWSIYAFRGDLHQWQYAYVRFWRKKTAMTVAQAMDMAERLHWGPRSVG